MARVVLWLFGVICGTHSHLTYHCEVHSHLSYHCEAHSYATGLRLTQINITSVTQVAIHCEQ